MTGNALLRPGILTALGLLSLLGLLLWWMMFTMPMDEMPMGWSAGVIGATGVMWLLMMLAMMLPAMLPVTGVYAKLAAKEDRGARLVLRILAFFAGHFTLWAAVALAMGLAQLLLRDNAWLTMGGTLATPPIAALLLILAGLWQFTSVKDTCLKHCRSPMAFLLAHWREGLAGAFPVGFRHGAYCVGCCVAIMGLMFLFGAMNPWWMAVITVFFLWEKVGPAAECFTRPLGAVMVGIGLIVLIQVLL